MPLSEATGEPIEPFPVVDGHVAAVVPDGRGGWYISGSFTQVGGVARSGIAHLLAEGSLDLAWSPAVTGGVLACVGGTLYVQSWTFDAKALEFITKLLALDPSGQPTAWQPPPVTGFVSALAVSGNTVYAGGDFTAVGGEPRSQLASFDATTGTLTAWAPQLSAGIYHGTSTVQALALVGDVLYVGGSFDKVDGESRIGLAAFDGSGQLTSWGPPIYSGSVFALAARGSTIYVGGWFEALGSEARSGLAAIDSGGQVLPWGPATDGTVLALAIDGDTIFVGGGFTGIGAVRRSRLAAVGLDGAVSGWAPEPDPGPELVTASGVWQYDNHGVLALAAASGKVFAGGNFEYVGSRSVRRGLAAYDSAGHLTTWAPHVDGEVWALAWSAGRLYVGGDFQAISGTPRANLASVSAAGEVSSWNPGVGGAVHALLATPEALFLGGAFAIVGGRPHLNLAAVGLDGGPPLTADQSGWNPSPNAVVTSLTAEGGTLYVGGYFTGFGSTERLGLAAFDSRLSLAPWGPALGRATPDPADAPGATALVARGGIVYVAGHFDTLAGNASTCVALVDANGQVLDASVADGLYYPWNEVSALTATDDRRVVMVGELAALFWESPWPPGLRSDITGAAFLGAGGLSTAVPVPAYVLDTTRLSFLPRARAVAVAGGKVYVGGVFHWDLPGGGVVDNLAAVDTASGQIADWTPILRP
ncbi:hypothetical protein [Anaeromyxobacter oryzae]|uniref:hypothetical protein n=1 Tax=Anaeromyxobacter oryzae TaxID=2918170 RepID=UPI0020BD4699|nr:hypothetical protein [Anaeromyxobacter oryzae]